MDNASLRKPVCANENNMRLIKKEEADIDNFLIPLCPSEIDSEMDR